MSTLFYGDNLDVLRKHVPTESIDLCYIDPPFNSKRNYNQIYNRIGSEDQAQAQAFMDTWGWDDQAKEGFPEIVANERGLFQKQTVELIKGLHRVLGEDSLLAYLVSMTRRIVEIRRVLKSTGSFYLHCDPTASHYLKLVCDSVFCSQGGDFLNEIVWKRTTAHSDGRQGRKAYGNISDVLLFYAKSDTFTFNVQHVGYDEAHLKKYRAVDSSGRRYALDNLTGPGGAAKGNPKYDVMGVSRYWRFSQERMSELIKNGRVVQPKPGAVPRYKRYLDEMPGVSIQNIWDDISPINSQAKERLGYPTQKPEALLERIIKASSNEDDVVLDAYCGCGTAVAVAQQLGRQWIGIDITYQAIAVILERLEKQAGKTAWSALEKSIALHGIPRDMASAEALAHKKDDRVRKEFEKWAVLTYTSNRGVINDKKGADAGIDGTVYFLTSPTDNGSMVLQVKSGGVSRGDVAKLHSDMQREGAVLATLITLEEPSEPMHKEARATGRYHHALMGRDYDVVRIVTVREIIEEGLRLDLPLSRDVLKAAPVAQPSANQLSLLAAAPPAKRPRKR